MKNENNDSNRKSLNARDTNLKYRIAGQQVKVLTAHVLK